MSTSRLGTYLADLAHNANARHAFDTDHAAAMITAKLSEEEQAVLGTGQLATILDYLDDGGTRPTTPDREPGNGSGSGGTTGGGTTGGGSAG